MIQLLQERTLSKNLPLSAVICASVGTRFSSLNKDLNSATLLSLTSWFEYNCIPSHPTYKKLHLYAFVDYSTRLPRSIRCIKVAQSSHDQ